MCEPSSGRHMVVEGTAVPGLLLCQDFLDLDQDQALCEAIDTLQWKPNRQGTRRVQIYGPHHDDRFRVHKRSIVTELPEFAAELIPRVVELGLAHFPEALYLYKLGTSRLTELFVNEYHSEDELQFHCDHNVTYEEVIVGVSLLSGSVLRFRAVDGDGEEVAVELPRGSCYLMSGASRVQYQHGMVAGDCSARRVSLTFRVVSESNLV
eukprot:TRINITY_DN50030_c0_g1_i3.p1 TRINITY_DN50030_c0_g1~~TRINITY_DN50030_c0_g1_i3.p1  ORF type:complete len:208 (-),score=33.12 TRINITY_DN50030_c0_g1_i3:159-782(-)